MKTIQLWLDLRFLFLHTKEIYTNWVFWSKIRIDLYIYIYMQKGNAQIVVPRIWITRLSLDKMQECSSRRYLRQNPSKYLHGILQSCWNLLHLLIQPDPFNWECGRDQEGAKKRERERDQARTRGIARIITSMWKCKTWARSRRRRSGG